MPERARFRTVFISDTHLGASGARAADLARFLKRIECQTLFLVGDVIDMWRLRQRWYWPEPNNRVVNRILKMARRGTRVVFIPGNHDESARRYAGLVFGGVEITLQATHQTADGRSILITHGDQFDVVVRHARILSAVGVRMYDWLVRLNFHYNWVRRLLGLEYWSLSQFIKLKVKSACSHISRFEEVLIEEARRTGHDAVLCGHIHKAESRDGPITYYNCGDWIESCSALVEHHDGRMELIDGLELIQRVDQMRRDATTSVPPRIVAHKLALVEA